MKVRFPAIGVIALTIASFAVALSATPQVQLPVTPASTAMRVTEGDVSASFVPSTVGPQSAITCPAGAVDVWPATSIPEVVSAFPGGTTFCVRAGIHYLTEAITPKSGDVFVGSYGAILDGSNWTTGDATQAAFRAHNQDIDYVTIRNLVIRNMPQRGIHAYYWMSDHWTVEYTEIAASGNVGLVIPTDSVIRNNYIHHNTFSGYIGQFVHNSTFDSNEIAYNGFEQKIGESANVTFRNNFVHHNAGAGIWFDSNNTGTLIEGNRVDDNGMTGIFYEISSDGVIRNNIIRRNGEAGVLLSVSKNVQIYNNTLEHNFRAITYFLRCTSVGGPTDFDLANDVAYGNTIVVGGQSGAYANVFNYTSCTSDQVAPYLNGSKNLTFSSNIYSVPSPNGWYWFWGDDTQLWHEWQALGQDADSTLGQ
jgi:parallel beta-helix repeat protein